MRSMRTAGLPPSPRVARAKAKGSGSRSRSSASASERSEAKRANGSSKGRGSDNSVTVNSFYCLPSTVTCRSGIHAAKPLHRCHPAYREHVRGSAKIHCMPLRQLFHLGEPLRHALAQAIVHHVFRPEVTAAVLHPLEVRNGYSARICEDVRDNENALVVENGIRSCSSGAVGGFHDVL